MSSLCQHILYPNINVTGSNQSPEQRGTALQPNVSHSYTSSSHGSACMLKDFGNSANEVVFPLNNNKGTLIYFTLCFSLFSLSHLRLQSLVLSLVICPITRTQIFTGKLSCFWWRLLPPLEPTMLIPHGQTFVHLLPSYLNLCYSYWPNKSVGH